MATRDAMNDARLKPYLAEFAGTYLLVLFAAGAVIVTTLIDGSPSAIVCGLSSGLVLTAVIWALARVSGAHVNPALSLALAYLGRLSWRRLPGYVLAQLAGSACAGLTLLWALGDFGAVGANLPNAALGISHGAAFGLEAILSFIMMLAILLCGDADDGIIHTGAVRIGAIVGIEVMLFGPIAGAAMNPARAFGPYLAMGDWSTFWIYLAGPLVGIMGAAMIYQKTAARISGRAEESRN
jgi:MIP family channel proteins